MMDEARLVVGVIGGLLGFATILYALRCSGEDRLAFLIQGYGAVILASILLTK